MEKPSMEAPLLTSCDNKREGGGEVVREVKKQLWLAGPLIAGNLLQTIIQVISIMFVGHLGELALSGSSMANSFATVTGFSVLVCPLHHNSFISLLLYCLFITGSEFNCIE